MRYARHTTAVLWRFRRIYGRNSRPRSLPDGLPPAMSLLLPACRARLVAAFLVAACAGPAAAQRPTAAPLESTSRAAGVPVTPARARWSHVTVAAEWAHVGAGRISRPDQPFTAARSMAGALSVPVGGAARPALRVDLGWIRAVRSANTSQGATLGASLPITAPGLGGRVRVYPGVATAAGWAETQGITGRYDWRGLDGTAYAGQEGAQSIPAVVRSRITGVGAQLSAEASLDGLLGRESHGVALAGSARRWAFRGRAAAPNRRVTLVGVGVAVRPSALLSRGGAR